MLPRMHGISLILTIVCVGALVQFGLLGVTIGMSASAVGVGVYAVRGMNRALGIALGDLVSEIWPPAIAAIVMAGLLFCLEHFVVHAERHGTILGLLLLAGEVVLGAAIYLGVLAVVAPHATRELVGAVGGQYRSALARKRPRVVR
jgi:hypothetical protein